MPTLLQINTVVNSGSHGRIAEEIGQLVLAKGWNSYIAYGRNDRPSQSNLIKIGNDIDIKIHGLQTRLLDGHGFGSKKATIKLVEQIKEIKPDVIHLHNIHGYYINIEILFKYLASSTIPVVWTLHDCWAFTGHCSHFDYIGCNRWKTGCYSCPQKNEYPASLVLDNSKSNYQKKLKLFTSVKNLTIVPVSNWLANIVKESFLKNHSIQHIYNGVNLETFSPQYNRIAKTKLGIENRFMILGVASGWSSRKGLNDFISLSKLINSDWVIVMVGLNNKQLKGLPSNIIGVSRTENMQQLAEMYSAADILLNLSVEETYGLTTVEGFSCGTPSIVYNCTASPELISKETGFVVKKGDLNTIIDAITLVKEKGKSAYATACRERAISLYNKDDRYKEYLNLYETLISNKTNS